MNGIGQAVDYLGAGLRQFPEGALRPVLIALLGFTFLWSGIAKTRSPWSTAFALVDFGVAKQPHIPLVWVLIIGELGLGALLLISPVVSSGLVLLATAIAACTLLIFTAFIARALRAGRRFACACFGSDGEEITWTTLIRSVTLAVVAMSCAGAGPIGALFSLDALVLTWCAAASTLGICTMAIRIRRLAQLPQPCWDGSA